MNDDIREEIINVTVKKYTCKDGVVFLSDGPSKKQQEVAKNKAIYHNNMYDFTHYEINSEIIKKYKSENFTNFKMLFFNKYISTYKWCNGYHYKPYLANVNFDFVKNLNEKDFLEIVEKIFLNKDSNFCFQPNLFQNNDFLELLLFSGVLDFQKMFIKYNKNVVSDIIFQSIPMNNLDILDKAIKNGLVEISLNNIKNLYHCIGWGQLIEEKLIFMSNKYSEYMPKSVEDEYNFCKTTIIRGTKNEILSDKNYTLSYYISDVSEKYIHMCFEFCKYDKQLIYASLFRSDMLRPNVYGLISTYYKYFYNLSDNDADIKAQDDYLSYLFLLNERYKYDTQILKPSIHLLEAILTEPSNNFGISQQRYMFENGNFLKTLNYLIEHFSDKKDDIEIFTMWMTKGKYIKKIFLDLSLKIDFETTYSIFKENIKNILTQINISKEIKDIEDIEAQLKEKKKILLSIK